VLATITGGTHVQQVAGAVVVPPSVTIAVEQASPHVVADNPVPVGAAAGVLGDKGVPQVTPMSRRAVQNTYSMGSARLDQRQRGDQPDAVLGVVGDRGVGGTIVRAVCVFGGVGQQSARLDGAVVGRGGIADGAGATIEDALDLGVVVGHVGARTDLADEGVTTELSQPDIGKGSQ
jgi:hypothetical protein